MHESKNNKADGLVEMTGVVYKKRRPGLKFKKIPAKKLGTINLTGTSVGEVAEKMMEEAIREHGKGISIKLSTQVSM